MIQRLLRGRLVYLFLGALVVFLYARALSVRSLPPIESAHAPQVSEPLEWWPKALDADALKRIVIHEPRLGLLLVVLTAFVAVMGFGGLGLAVWGLCTGRLRTLWRGPSMPLPRWSFGELARIVMLTLLIASLMPFVRFAVISFQPLWILDLHLWITVSMMALDLFVMLTILTFALEKGSSVWQTVGLTTRDVGASIRTGLLGYLAVFPWLFFLLFLIVALARALGLQPPLEPIHELIFQEHRPEVLALTVVLACVVGPVAEELFFRGVLYATIRRYSSRWVAMLLSGALFSLVHTNLIGFLPIMVLGCLLAYLYERTGSLIAPMTIHILHNTYLLSLALVFRQLMTRI